MTRSKAPGSQIQTKIARDARSEVIVDRRRRRIPDRARQKRQGPIMGCDAGAEIPRLRLHERQSEDGRHLEHAADGAGGIALFDAVQETAGYAGAFGEVSRFNPLLQSDQSDQSDSLAQERQRFTGISGYESICHRPRRRSIYGSQAVAVIRIRNVTQPPVRFRGSRHIQWFEFERRS